MSELQIQENLDQTTPDAVKAGAIEKFEEDQKESIKKAEETRKDLNPEELQQLLGFLGETGSGFSSFGATEGE